MSQAEALLNSISEGVPVHTHPVPDTDTYFVIDPITRKIENTNRKKNVIMQYDHNSERFTFELPRYIDGHDMLECTSVTVNVDNIEVVESDSADVIEPYINSDAPDMTDLRVHPNDPEKVISSWLISRNSTQLAGILSFHIEYKCVDSDGNVVYEWSTDTYDDIEIRARKKNGEAAVLEHSDLLEQWRANIFGAGNSVMANIAAEGEAQVAAVKAESETQQEAVELKGAQTLDTIPEDYTETNNMADEAVRSKADAIVCEATDKSIVLKDSSNDHIRGLKLFGKSVQDGTPTPDNPVDIVSVENPKVGVYGNNLLAVPEVGRTWTANGLTCTYEGDGIFHFTGTYTHMTTDAGFGTVYMDIPIDRNAKYTLSAKLIEGTPPDTFNPYIGLSSDTKNHQNFLAVNIEPDTEVGSVVSWTRLPSSYLSDAKKISRFWIYLHNGTQTTYSVDFKFQVWLNKSDTAMEYTPYHGQSMEIDRTLSGIPVTSGGNYTDSDGQQWICDEVDLERGVYVKRIEKIVCDLTAFNNGDTLTNTVPLRGASTSTLLSKTNGVMLCTVTDKYAYNRNDFVHMYTEGTAAWVFVPADYDYMTNPPAVLAALATPIETPLTAEEITAFKTLRTNCPNTTILNDAGAWMSVKYNADTKTYVENPKTLKLVDSSTGVVYELKIVNGSLTVNPV